MKVCKTCHGGCCRALSLELTGDDILRIWKILEIDPFFFVAALPVEGENLKNALGKQPLFIFKDLGLDRYNKICIQSDLSRYFSYTNKCVFLQEWEGETYNSQELKGVFSRCGIYSARPIACRTFPARLDDNGNAVIFDPYCKVQNEKNEFWKKEAYQLCPRPLNEDDYLFAADEYIKNLAINDYETKFFRKLSEKWNQNPGVSDNFPEFLEKEYRNRIIYQKEYSRS